MHPSINSPIPSLYVTAPPESAGSPGTDATQSLAPPTSDEQIKAALTLIRNHPAHPAIIAFRNRQTSDASTQTDYVDGIRTGTMVNVQALFNGIDNQIPIGEAQDAAMADAFARASSFPAPKNSAASDCVCLPPDVMAYKITHQDGSTGLAYTCPEINGTGFGGIRDLPPKQLKTVMDGYARAADEVRQDCARNGHVPFMVIANSGREGATGARVDGVYPKTAGSKMIWEKAYPADVGAERFGTIDEPVYGSSFDELSTPYYKAMDAAAKLPDRAQREAAETRALADAVTAMRGKDKQALAALAYSINLVDCGDVKDGWATVFGRPVDGLVNDRAALNLMKKAGQPIDYKKTRLINCTVEEGVNKFAAALARDEFHGSAQARMLPELARQRGFTYDVQGLDKSFHYATGATEQLDGMDEAQVRNHRLTYFRGVSEEEGIEGAMKAVDDFLALGMRPLFKPNGTGQSKGIIGFREGEDRDAFKARFKANIVDVERMFGKGAGYPFMVEPLKDLAETKDGEMYDLRFATYQDSSDAGARTLHSIPLILKKEPKQEVKSKEFSPTNVTAAVAKTGRPGTDFIVPLSTADGLEQAGLSDGQAKSMGLYFAAFQSWLLETKYPREGADELDAKFIESAPVADRRFRSMNLTVGA